jgi:membrane protein implicated in regulation of membrane protease activity
VLAALWFKVFRQIADKTRSGQAAEALGEIGVLVRAVEPFQKGEVRFQKPVMGSEVWPCLADEAIPAGQRVKVLAVDGQLLKVGKNT